jgi:hypothetical protein
LLTNQLHLIVLFVADIISEPAKLPHLNKLILQIGWIYMLTDCMYVRLEALLGELGLVGCAQHEQSGLENWPLQDSSGDSRRKDLKQQC